MSTGGALGTSILAMMAQSHAMGNISQNIANVNTNGYKLTETLFKTLLSESTGHSNFFSVQTADRTLLDRMGGMTSTGGDLHLAINGDGFFVLNSKPDGSGQTVYSRNGSFETVQINNAVYLSVNGYYLMGRNPGGVALTPVRISLNEMDADGQYTGRSIAGTASSVAGISGNLDATATTVQAMSFEVFDSRGNRQRVSMSWEPLGLNSWTLNVMAGTNSVSVPVSFDASGALVTPKTVAVTGNWGTAGAGSFTLDMSKITSLGGTTSLDDYTVNGTAPGLLKSYAFNTRGELAGLYTNGEYEILSRIPVAIFAAPNSLLLQSGTVFLESLSSGFPSYRLMGETGSSQTFVAGAVEQSNVDLATEFTNMIMSQKAYNSAATVFRTANEMTELVAEMKR